MPRVRLGSPSSGSAVKAGLAESPAFEQLLVWQVSGARNKSQSCMFCTHQTAYGTPCVDEDFNDAGEQLAIYINQLIRAARHLYQPVN
jgi:hypothetical protein